MILTANFQSFQGFCCTPEEAAFGKRERRRIAGHDDAAQYRYDNNREGAGDARRVIMNGEKIAPNTKCSNSCGSAQGIFRCTFSTCKFIRH